jgi:hypothetical protein
VHAGDGGGERTPGETGERHQLWGRRHWMRARGDGPGLNCLARLRVTFIRVQRIGCPGVHIYCLSSSSTRANAGTSSIGKFLL